MKGIVIYDTSTGNTKKIAETITETLKESGIESDLFYSARYWQKVTITNANNFNHL